MTTEENIELWEFPLNQIVPGSFKEQSSVSEVLPTDIQQFMKTQTEERI